MLASLSPLCKPCKMLNACDLNRAEPIQVLRRRIYVTLVLTSEVEVSSSVVKSVWEATMTFSRSNALSV